MKKLIVSALIIFFVIFPLHTLLQINSAKCDGKELGVKVGDWALYNLTVLYETNDPNPPFSLQPSESPEWIRDTIINIVNENVTIEEIIHFYDGRFFNFSFWIDFTTENESSSLTPGLFVGMELLKPANLTQGDKVLYPDYFYGDWVAAGINETIFNEEYGMVREINHLNITRTIGHDHYVTFGSMNFYWDRLTGIPLQIAYIIKELNTDGGYITEESIICNIVNTNLWKTPPKVNNFSVYYQNTNFTLTALTNSTITNFEFEPAQNRIKINTTGLSATFGYCNISIPKMFMWCDSLSQWLVTVDGFPPNTLEVTENATYTFLYFTYNHSSHEIIITATHVVPEFPQIIILPLIIPLFISVIIFMERKVIRKSISHNQ